MACACFHAQEAAKLAGYHSPTSRESPEKLNASPSEEWYSESSARTSLFPAIKKRDHEALDADIDSLSSHNSDPEVCRRLKHVQQTTYGVLQQTYCQRPRSRCHRRRYNPDESDEESTGFFRKSREMTSHDAAGNQARHELELIATVFGTSRRQGLAIYNRWKGSD